MYFDLPAFFRYNFRAFFQTRGEHYRLTPRRFVVLLVWLVLYIPAQVLNRVFFLLDEVLFPAYRRQQITRPVFIIGNPRSGSTYLQRLLAKDSGRFTSLTAWEMIFAPSITQRKLIWGAARLVSILGYPLARAARALNRALARETPAHTVGLLEAEEDEFLLVHGWCTEALWPLYPFRDELLPYYFFDRDIPAPQQQRVMGLYRSLLQRHVYAHGGGQTILSKNPSQSGKMAALQAVFPDACFINLVRSPYETVPSMMDFMAAGWKLFCDPLEPYPHRAEFFEVMRFYYLYPAEYFSSRPEACSHVRYADLVQKPREVVEGLYAWLGLEISAGFARHLAESGRRAGQYHSRHEYSVESVGLSEQAIYAAFGPVFEAYHITPHRGDLPENDVFLRVRDWQHARARRRQERRGRRQERRLRRQQHVQHIRQAFARKHQHAHKGGH